MIKSICFSFFILVICTTIAEAATTFRFDNSDNLSFDFVGQTPNFSGIFFGGGDGTGDLLDVNESFEVSYGSFFGGNDLGVRFFANDVTNAVSTTNLFFNPRITITTDIVYATVRQVSGTFDVLSLDIRFPAGVQSSGAVFRGKIVAGIPEPSTWLMMIFGFAISGLVLRRRQKRAFAA